MRSLHPKMKAKDGSLVLIFDIASASVGGLLFRQRIKKAPEIIISMRRPVIFNREDSFQKIWQAFHESFKLVSRGLKSAVTETPEMALCVFSSPWYVSQTRKIKVQRRNPFQITRELLNKLIKDEADVFKNFWHDSTLGEKGESVFLEKEPITTALNGYFVESALNKKAHKLELSAYLSMGLKVMEQKTKHDILYFLKSDSVFFHSFPFVALRVLKHVINTEDGLLLVDITGELTDVFLVRNNAVEEANCIAKGENFLARRVASVFNTDFLEAKTLLAQYERKELDSNYVKRIKEVLTPAAEEWLNDLKRLLKSMAHEKLLPQNFYFCGPAGSLEEISDTILSEDFSKLTASGKPFIVNRILPESLKYHFDFVNGFSNNRDIFLLLEALFASKAVAE